MSEAAANGETDREVGGVPSASAELEAVIRSEIGDHGPITFARFMDLALYHPGLGYYRQPADRPTRAGDFLTGPEAHPIFGWTIARQIEEMWRRLAARRPFSLVEYGAGSGTLGLSILDGLRRHKATLLDAIRYEPVESNPHRVADLRRRFEAAGFAERLDLRDPADQPLVVGAVLANEFLDALPVHRVVRTGGRLQELYVTWRDRFVEIASEPSSGALEARLDADEVELAEGQVAEICLGLEPWFDEVSRRLARGFVIVIDYGHPAAELYGRRHLAGTLLGYRGQRVETDPFSSVGGQDLTAHVDFTALRRLAEARGFRCLGFEAQSEFLVNAGLAEELHALQQSPATALEEYALARSALVRMLDPRAMGRFRVLVLGRDVPDDPLTGLTPPRR